MAETLANREEKLEGIDLIERYRNKYPRHSAFKSEITQAFNRKGVRVLMSDNIFSFEEYREKKLGRQRRESPLDELFRKDLREQRDLLDWYSFHNIFNKHKLFVHTLFLENHAADRKNPNSGYVVCYNDEQLEINTKKVAEAIEWQGRNPVIVNATDKTFRQVGQIVERNYAREN